MKIDEQILLNQLAQGLIDFLEGERWFSSLGEGEKRTALQELNFMIANANPRNEDVPTAIAKSGLKSTCTPCVLLTRGEVRIQLAKIVNLPEDELLKSFSLLVALLGVCDNRRGQVKPPDTENHWWHRDLNDPDVVRAIKQQFGRSNESGGNLPSLRPRRIK
jgi:hypothetical protein